MRGRMRGMLVSSDTPEPHPNRRMYICPGCKTPIPFGTETSEPPDNCPKCGRRLYIPTIIGGAVPGRTRERPESRFQQHSVNPRRFHKLRMAWSILWGLAALMLI